MKTTSAAIIALIILYGAAGVFDASGSLKLGNEKAYTTFCTITTNDMYIAGETYTGAAYAAGSPNGYYFGPEKATLKELDNYRFDFDVFTVNSVMKARLKNYVYLHAGFVTSGSSFIPETGGPARETTHYPTIENDFSCKTLDDAKKFAMKQTNEKLEAICAQANANELSIGLAGILADNTAVYLNIRPVAVYHCKQGKSCRPLEPVSAQWFRNLLLRANSTFYVSTNVKPTAVNLGKVYDYLGQGRDSYIYNISEDTVTHGVSKARCNPAQPDAKPETRWYSRVNPFKADISTFKPVSNRKTPQIVNGKPADDVACIVRRGADSKTEYPRLLGVQSGRYLSQDSYDLANTANLNSDQACRDRIDALEFAKRFPNDVLLKYCVIPGEWLHVTLEGHVGVIGGRVDKPYSKPAAVLEDNYEYEIIKSFQCPMCLDFDSQKGDGDPLTANEVWVKNAVGDYSVYHDEYDPNLGLLIEKRCKNNAPTDVLVACKGQNDACLPNEPQTILNTVTITPTPMPT
ncbi:MAG: hypothetical protein AABW54_04265, partial [Candidatus Micrarchaeota archaeon]